MNDMCWNCCGTPGPISERFCDDCLGEILRGSTAGEGEFWINHPVWPSYFLSSFGRVKRRGVILNPYRQGRYPAIIIKGQKRKVHILVLESFIGLRPDGLLGLHWDDDPDNNFLHNLHWGDTKANSADAKRNGRIGKARPKKLSPREQCYEPFCKEPLRSNGMCDYHFRIYRRECFRRALAAAQLAEAQV